MLIALGEVSRKAGLPFVEPLSEERISQAYDCYNAFNCAYDGVTVDDIIECDAYLRKKIKEAR